MSLGMIHESMNKMRRKKDCTSAWTRKAEVPNNKAKLYKGKGKRGFGPGMSVINERSKRCKSDDTTTIEVEDVSAWVPDGYHVTYPNSDHILNLFFLWLINKGGLYCGQNWKIIWELISIIAIFKKVGGGSHRVTHSNLLSSKFRANYLGIWWSYKDDFGCVRLVSTSRYAPHLEIYNLVKF